MSTEDKSVENSEEIIEQTESLESESVADDSIAQQVEDSVSETASELEKAQEEIAKLKDQYIRTEAEMANLRRRVEKDVENAHKFGQEKLSKELLTVADNLERAVQSTEGDMADVTSIREGVELTLRGLMDVFGKFNIDIVDPHGEPFDPQQHQAMSMVENNEVEPNTVIAVMQKGYLLHGRLIRPAMVMVSKGAANASKIDEKA